MNSQTNQATIKYTASWVSYYDYSELTAEINLWFSRAGFDILTTTKLDESDLENIKYIWEAMKFYVEGQEQVMHDLLNDDRGVDTVPVHVYKKTAERITDDSVNDSRQPS